MICNFNKIRVKNLHDGSRKPPSGYSSWINYWDDNNSSIITNCSRCGSPLSKDEAHGGHVKKVNSFDNDWYIVPLCETCNEKKDDNPFEVDPDLLVKANVQKQSMERNY